MALKNNDLFLVNRNKVSYKAEAAELKNFVLFDQLNSTQLSDYIYVENANIANAEKQLTGSGGGSLNRVDYREIEVFKFSALNGTNNTLLSTALVGHTLVVYNKTKGENVLFDVLDDYIDGSYELKVRYDIKQQLNDGSHPFSDIVFGDVMDIGFGVYNQSGDGGGGVDPSDVGNGILSFIDPKDGSTQLEFSANQDFNVSLTLPKGFSGNYLELDNTPQFLGEEGIQISGINNVFRFKADIGQGLIFNGVGTLENSYIEANLGAGLEFDVDGKIAVIGGTPGVANDGALNIYDHNGIITGQEVAVFTADQATTTNLVLPKGFSGDYDDLTNTPDLVIVDSGSGINVTPSAGTDETIYTVSADIDTSRGIVFNTERIAANIGTGLTFNNSTGAIETTLSGTTFRGAVDLTVNNTNLQGDSSLDDVTDGAVAGDLYANTGGDADGNGKFSAAWGTITQNATAAVTVCYPGDFIVYDGTTWNHLTTGTSNIGTNLTNTPTFSDVTVESSTGTNTSILEATTTRAGVMTKLMFDKFDNIEPGAEQNVATDLDVDNRTATTMNVTSTTGSLTGTPAALPLVTDSLSGLMHPGHKNKLDTITPGAEVNEDTNLGLDNRNDLTLDVTSSTGADVTIPSATETLSGLMTAADKVKLNDSPTAIDIGNGQITLLDQSGLVIGTFNVNQKTSEIITINSGGASVSTGETPPTNPSDGDLWWNSGDGEEAGGRLYIYYDDGDTTQWVDTSLPGGGGGFSGDYNDLTNKPNIPPEFNLDDGSYENDIIHWADLGSVQEISTTDIGLTSTGNSYSNIAATGGSGSGLICNVIRRKTTGAHEVYIAVRGKDYVAGETVFLDLGTGTNNTGGINCTIDQVNEDNDGWIARPGKDYFVSSIEDSTNTGATQFMTGAVFGGKPTDLAGRSTNASLNIHPIGDKSQNVVNYYGVSAQHNHYLSGNNINFAFLGESGSNIKYSRVNISKNSLSFDIAADQNGLDDNYNSLFHAGLDSDNKGRIILNEDKASNSSNWIEIKNTQIKSNTSGNKALTIQSSRGVYNFNNQAGTTGYQINAQQGSAGFILPADAALASNYDTEGEYIGPVQDRVATLQQEKDALLATVNDLVARVTALEGA